MPYTKVDQFPCNVLPALKLSHIDPTLLAAATRNDEELSAKDLELALVGEWAECDRFPRRGSITP